MDLPQSLLPDSLDDLSLEEIRDRAVSTAKLIDRSHYDLGRVLTPVQTLALPKIRAAYASGEASVAKVRAVVAVATPATEDHWLDVVLTRPYRLVYAMVKAELHGRAERGEAPWPET